MLKPLRTVAPAAAETLLPLDELKRHLNITFDDDDLLLRTLAEAAVAKHDGWAGELGRALLTQSWKCWFASFACQWVGSGGSTILRLPFGDLVAVTSVKYFDTSNAQQTLSAAVYQAFSDEAGPFLMLQPGQQWPSITSRPDAVEVVWQAGYGSTAAAVPADIRLALMMLAGHWYKNRETVTLSQMTVQELPFATRALLEKYRATRF